MGRADGTDQADPRWCRRGRPTHMYGPRRRLLPHLAGACPACARPGGADEREQAAQVFVAARRRGFPRVVVEGVRVVEGEAGWAAFCQTAPMAALGRAGAALGVQARAGGEAS